MGGREREMATGRGKVGQRRGEEGREWHGCRMDGRVCEDLGTWAADRIGGKGDDATRGEQYLRRKGHIGSVQLLVAIGHTKKTRMLRRTKRHGGQRPGLITILLLDKDGLFV